VSLEEMRKKVKEYEESLKEKSLSYKETWKAMSVLEKIFMVSLVVMGIGLVMKGSIMIGSSL